MNNTFLSLLLTASLLLTVNEVSGESQSLCNVDGCECSDAGVVHCYCHHKQVLKIGLENIVEASEPSPETRSLTIENCHHVELFAGILNHMEKLQNLTIKHCHAVVIHPKIFDSRGASEQAGTVANIEVSNVRKLQVRRYSFKDLTVTGRFFLGEVIMDSVVSMAFHFKFVNEFSVFASNFERIAMFGIKLDECKEFNILGMTQFTSLSAHAIKLKCDKFSLAYNWFGTLHDSSFDVEFGLCDIQGNTFFTLQGKPFLSLSPQFSLDNELSQMGLVFRENKFASFPDLPFASLALPSFENLPASTSYIDVDNNHFLCDCQAIGWFLAFGQFDHNRGSLASVRRVAPTDDAGFIRQVFNSSGQCLSGCQELGDCHEMRDTVRQFADEAVKWNADGDIRCHGVAVKNHDAALSITKKDDGVRNGKLVNSEFESAERLTDKLILMNDGSSKHSNGHKFSSLVFFSIFVGQLSIKIFSR